MNNVQNMQNMQNLQNMQYTQNMQNTQKMQIMQNMQNIKICRISPPLFFSSKEQKSKIPESKSSINSRNCLGHLVLFLSKIYFEKEEWSLNTPRF